MTRLRFALSVMAVAMLSRQAEAQLVTNGDFESGNLLGWTLTGSSCSTGVIAGAQHSGTYGLRSGPVAGTCTVAQTIATTAGEQYTFSFWLSNTFGGTPNSFDALWNGVSVYSLSNASTFNYTQQVFSEIATGPTTTISFVVRHDPDFYRVDDVVVTATSTVPEPSTYALMAVGLAGLFAARRRRRA